MFSLCALSQVQLCMVYIQAPLILEQCTKSNFVFILPSSEHANNDQYVCMYVSYASSLATCYLLIKTKTGRLELELRLRVSRSRLDTLKALSILYGDHRDPQFKSSPTTT